MFIKTSFTTKIEELFSLNKHVFLKVFQNQKLCLFLFGSKAWLEVLSLCAICSTGLRQIYALSYQVYSFHLLILCKV